jgi:hypothetical protein
MPPTPRKECSEQHECDARGSAGDGSGNSGRRERARMIYTRRADVAACAAGV